jgi:hypothetical protein
LFFIIFSLSIQGASQHITKQNKQTNEEKRSSIALYVAPSTAVLVTLATLAYYHHAGKPNNASLSVKYRETQIVIVQDDILNQPVKALSMLLIQHCLADVVLTEQFTRLHALS